MYAGSPVYITPTFFEAKTLIDEGIDVIATDGTLRLRPRGETLSDLVKKIRDYNDKVLLMADCSTVEEGENAEKLGFDFIGTTLSGYTEYTKGVSLPDYEMIGKLVRILKTPVIAEGGIKTPEELKKALDSGAFAAVVGGAITRPKQITERFVSAIKR